MCLVGISRSREFLEVLPSRFALKFKTDTVSMKVENMKLVRNWTIERLL